MKCATLALSALVALTPVFAAPAVKKSQKPTDDQILQYALTLEHLENSFYSGALEKFDEAAFTDAGYPFWARGRLQQIADHEATHVAFLQKALGSAATKPCTYSFPYTDVKSFTALSAILEGVGVSAYLGAAKYISNPDYLTAAASILTTESRHQAWVNSVANHENPWSGPFDAPLTLDEVYSLAGAFIKSCPDSNPTLPVKAFPGLTVETTTPKSGSKIDIDFKSPKSSGALYMAFIDSAGTQFAPINGKSVTIPEGLVGTVYGVVTTASSGTPTDDNIVAGPTIFTFGLDSNARQTS